MKRIYLSIVFGFCKASAAIGMQVKTEEDKKFLESVQTMSASYKGTLLSVKFDMPESAMARPQE